MKSTTPQTDPAQPDLPDDAYDWLDDFVTDEAKKDPNWRAKALSGYMLTAEAADEASPVQPPA